MLRLCIATLMVLIIAGCEDKADDKVFSAQACLNKATQATVDRCTAMVAGVATPQAYAVRCAAAFLKQGFDTSTIVQAIDELDDPGSSGATLTLLETLIFEDNSNAPSPALAAEAVAECRASGSSGILILALTAETATKLHKLATDLATTIGGLDPNSMTSNQLIEAGDSVLEAYPTLCAKGTSLSTTKACSDMREALTEAGLNPNQSSYSDAEKELFAEKFLPKL